MITEPNVLTTVATGALGFIVKVGLVIVLLFFLLASGDMFHEKLVKSLPTLTDKKRALGIALDIERELSRYLLTITIINTALGATIAGAMFAIGMPNPVLWGVAAGLLNFIPYVGALVGVIIVAFVALVSIEDLSHALLAPAAYFLITALEGQFLTPVIVGRRLDMNPVAILLAVAFWGWIWGIVGALIAVPLLLSLKVISDRIEGMHGLSEFLGPRDQAPGAN